MFCACALQYEYVCECVHVWVRESMRVCVYHVCVYVCMQVCICVREIERVMRGREE